MKKSVLSPIDSPYPENIAAALNAYPQRDGYILKLFRVFANSYRFLSGKGVVNLLDKASPLTLRQRELVILRVCFAKNCEYEWGVHVAAFAEPAKLNQQDIVLTCQKDVVADYWREDEENLLRVADELCSSGCLSDTTNDAFTTLWDKEQQLEILALCGNYHTACFVANVAQLAPEPFAARFPLPDKGRQESH